MKSLNELKALLTDLGLQPIVLSEQPSGGRTIVEKLDKLEAPMPRNQR
jgi:predicted nucleotide-binding protein